MSSPSSVTETAVIRKESGNNSSGLIELHHAFSPSITMPTPINLALPPNRFRKYSKVVVISAPKGKPPWRSKIPTPCWIIFAGLPR